MSGKKIALVAIPVAIVAIALAAVFAMPFLQNTPVPDSEGSAPIVPASAQDCNAVSPRVESILANAIGQATDETKGAANALVEQYCQKPELVREVSAMAIPARGLVAYACDVASGEIEGTGFQEQLAEYEEIYCNGALIVILEDSESLMVEAADYYESVLNQAESGDPETGERLPDVDVEEAEAQSQEIASLANKSQSQASEGQLYEAAKSLDKATKIVDSISQE